MWQRGLGKSNLGLRLLDLSPQIHEGTECKSQMGEVSMGIKVLTVEESRWGNELSGININLVEVVVCFCERCPHHWTQRKKEGKPKRCPKCKSPYWDRPRQIKARALSSD